MRNDSLIEKTVEITIAALDSPNTVTTSTSGQNVAEFMQQIYNKLVQLNKYGD